jgi:hypothetical protein
MTHNEFISLLQQTNQIENKYVSDLKELIQRYPYFGTAGLMYTKCLAQSQDINFSSFCVISALYTANRTWFYYYLFPEKTLSASRYRKEKFGNSSGDYFDMMEMLDAHGENNKKTLKNLADRLKAARNFTMQAPVNESVTLIEKDMTVATSNRHDLSIQSNIRTVGSGDFTILTNTDLSVGLEVQAKKLIAERKYSDAIDILQKLNLNNPKKSVYFADQIRFLEKVIANSKK